FRLSASRSSALFAAWASENKIKTFNESYALALRSFDIAAGKNIEHKHIGKLQSRLRESQCRDRQVPRPGAGGLKPARFPGALLSSCQVGADWRFDGRT